MLTKCIHKAKHHFFNVYVLTKPLTADVRVEINIPGTFVVPESSSFLNDLGLQENHWCCFPNDNVKYEIHNKNNKKIYISVIYNKIITN